MALLVSVIVILPLLREEQSFLPFFCRKHKVRGVFCILSRHRDHETAYDDLLVQLQIPLFLVLPCHRQDKPSQSEPAEYILSPKTCPQKYGQDINHPPGPCLHLLQRREDDTKIYSACLGTSYRFLT